MKLLATEIDNSLNLQLHVSTICKKAAGQINTLSHLKSCLNQYEKSIIAKALSIATLIIAHLFRIFLPKDG